MTDKHARKSLRRAVDDGPQLTSKTILVRVGAEKVEYHIYENLLRANSGFFDIALKKEWKEGQDRIVEMPKTNNEAFSIWVKWLYTGRMFLMQDSDHTEVDCRSMNQEWNRWRSCYALGNFLQDSDFKDVCIDACMEATIAVAGIPTLIPHCIYPYSTEASAHRKFAIDIFVHCWDRDEWTRDIKHPAEFLSDVIKDIGPKVSSGIKAQRLKDFFDLDDTCKYHDHGSKKPCYKTKPAFRF